MKIEIFAKTGKIEVDSLNALISMVKSDVIQPDTVIEAKGRRVTAAEIQELKPIFEELEQFKKKEKGESPEAIELRNHISACQKRLEYAIAARTAIRQSAIAVLIVIFFYAFPLVCVVLDEMVKLSEPSANRLEATFLWIFKMGYYEKKFSAFIAILSAFFVWNARKLAVVYVDKVIFEYQEKALAKSLHELLQ